MSDQIKTQVFKKIAMVVSAYQACVKTGNYAWREKHLEALYQLCKTHLPSGSGFDNGTQIDINDSTEEKLVFHTAFHHMKEGMYTEWSSHRITVTPSLAYGFNLKVSGKNVNDIKDYIIEAFRDSLNREVELIEQVTQE
ncbi:hypothetical protein [Chroococcidiopsis sp.]|uniref:hypothetical protein n=1 Tax=Chroococcidiopsis sp. TaxID=3088168 RepID=UPI003F2C8FD1